MSKPKPPKPTAPKKTAAASTSTNIGTAIANATLGNVNEVTADGSTNVTQSGMTQWKDPFTGKTFNIPQFTRTTTLSAANQAVKDQQDAARLGMATLGKNQTDALQSTLSTPFDGSNDATEARLIELGRKRLDPMLAQQDEALRTRLANQGLKVGTEAYDRELARQGQNTNDAYNQLILSGHGQAFQEGMAGRNQQINEAQALMNGGQVVNPNFMGANMPTIPTTDVAGLIANRDQQRQQNYQANMAQRNSLLGGLFGLGGSLIMASDKRVKREIKREGKLMGHNIYSYRYKGKFDDGGRHVGVMAQEVAEKRPDAVLTGSDGVKRVDYGKLFELGREMA